MPNFDAHQNEQDAISEICAAGLCDHAYCQADRITLAMDAVRTFRENRKDLGSGDAVREANEFFLDTLQVSKNQRREISHSEWLGMALMVDDACRDIGQPALYGFAA